MLSPLYLCHCKGPEPGFSTISPVSEERKVYLNTAIGSDIVTAMALVTVVAQVQSLA